MKILLILSSCLLLLSACVTSATKTTAISLGMTKPEVIAILGQPHSASANDGREFLTFMVSGRWAPPLNPNAKAFADTYIVSFRDGKVDAYGRPAELPEEVRMKVQQVK
jgi:outer membrane protein assembly factor BamE (lipoprotein component of BamABCDE complex)